MASVQLAFHKLEQTFRIKGEVLPSDTELRLKF